MAYLMAAARGCTASCGSIYAMYRYSRMRLSRVTRGAVKIIYLCATVSIAVLAANENHTTARQECQGRVPVTGTGTNAHYPAIHRKSAQEVARQVSVLMESVSLSCPLQNLGLHTSLHCASKI